MELLLIITITIIIVMHDLYLCDFLQDMLDGHLTSFDVQKREVLSCFILRVTSFHNNSSKLI